jgi:hypothetical protein
LGIETATAVSNQLDLFRHFKREKPDEDRTINERRGRRAQVRVPVLLKVGKDGRPPGGGGLEGAVIISSLFGVPRSLGGGEDGCLGVKGPRGFDFI